MVCVVLFLLASSAPAAGVAPPGAFPSSLRIFPRLSSVPSSPNILSGNPHPTSIALYWSSPAYSGGSPITGFTVTWSPAGTTNGSRRVGNVTSTVVGSLARNTSYTFQVAAWNTQGEGPFSSPYTVSTGDTPGAPANVTVSAGDTDVSVSWSPPALPLLYPVLGYLLNLTPDGGAPLLYPNVTSPAFVGGLTDGRHYTITVQAWNAVGWGATSPRILATPVGLPNAPGNLTASFNSTDGSILVTWAAPDLSGGLPIEGYALSWTAENGVVGDAYVVSGKLNYTIRGVAPGTLYTISISAQNTLGESAAAMISIPTPGSGSPGTAPTSWTEPWVVLGLFAGIITGTFALMTHWGRRRHGFPPHAPTASEPNDERSPPPRSPSPKA